MCEQEQIAAIRAMAATAEDRGVIDALLADAGERARAREKRADAHASGPAQRLRVFCPAHPHEEHNRLESRPGKAQGLLSMHAAP